jgi:glutamine synthetase
MSQADRKSGGAGSAPLSSSFGRYTFNLETMKQRLPRPVFEAIQATVRSGEPLDTGLADVVAGAMKDWAVEHGATHFTHWFQPLTGATAEKHDAFLSIDEGHPLETFSGSQLIQAEPDASSFPSGGMRSTFEARGYTAWDPTSPAFLVFHEGGATLTIPSVFVSYTGEALDKKTPLLRSMNEISRAAVESLRLMGREAVRVVPSLGAEQEYFLIRRDYYEDRPDLHVTGRTVIGAEPPKGQQLEDHYFGAIDSRALDFMAEVEAEAWKLGIPVKTRHNEVAPHQYEVAPIFGPAHVATDQNQLLMDLMRRVAKRRGLAVLFHEKPFAGVNGSGKHNNWSIADDRGRNLLEPGKDPHGNVEFLYFLCAVLKAVHKRALLLRASIAQAGNDHRLGANEAPPAIISVFLGERLTHILDTLAEGRTLEAVKDEVIRTGVEVLPELKRDNTDRNRTSPFAFTGNKFEFRAVGSSQSLAVPMVYLNVAVAEALLELNGELRRRLEAGEERDTAILAIVRDTYTASKAVVFNGNNYAEAWVEEAAKRGLPNKVDTPSALEVLADEETAAFLESHGVFKPHELTARYRIKLEAYCRSLKIEAIQTLRMAKTGVLPAAYRHQKRMADAMKATGDLGIATGPYEAEYAHYANAVNTTLDGVRDVREALANVPGDEHSPEQARYLADVMIPAMNALREGCDAIERSTDFELWPFPTYHQMLFQ